MSCTSVRLTTFLTLLTTSIGLAAPSQPINEQPALIPLPVSYEQQMNQPGFLLIDGIKIDAATCRSELGRDAIRVLEAASLRVLPEAEVGELQVLC